MLHVHTAPKSKPYPPSIRPPKRQPSAQRTSHQTRLAKNPARSDTRHASGHSPIKPVGEYQSTTPHFKSVDTVGKKCAVTNWRRFWDPTSRLRMPRCTHPRHSPDTRHRGNMGNTIRQPANLRHGHALQTTQGAYPTTVPPLPDEVTPSDARHQGLGNTRRPRHPGRRDAQDTGTRGAKYFFLNDSEEKNTEPIRRGRYKVEG